VNRRFLFLALILAALSAVLVYAAISRSGGDGGGAAGDIPVVVAKLAIPAGTRITDDMVELRQLPETAVGFDPLTATEDAVGRVAKFPLAANEQLLVSKVVSSTDRASKDVLSNLLERGERGFGIEVTAVIGAGGLVLPGDYVDVFWVPDGPATDVPGAQLLAEDIEVVSVQQTLVDLAPTAPGAQVEGQEQQQQGTSGERVRGSEADPIPDAATVTLMLTPEEAQRVFCGEETGSIRLAVRAFGDHDPSGLQPVLCVILGNNN
jgi:pilus assembly protein CpaB